jgi:hypothetical protein
MRSLKKYQVPIAYLHDSEIADCDKSEKIFLQTFDGDVLPPALSMTKINSNIILLIFYNHIALNYVAKLGQAVIDRDYSDFFKESFTIESQRMGCYSLIDEPMDNDYTLEIVYDTSKTEAKYHINITILFFLIPEIPYWQEVGFPAQTTLSVIVRLRKRDELVFEKRYSVDKTLPAVPSNNQNIMKMQYAFVTNMAESLSLGTKECIEQIIRDINLIINTH